MENETEQLQNIALIKMQVLELADRFDVIESTQRQQSVMLGYLVQTKNQETASVSGTGGH